MRRTWRAMLRAGLIWRARPPFWGEGISGLMTTCWAIHVGFMRGDLADRPAFVPLARIASDETWMALGMVVGLLQLLAWWLDSPGRWPLSVAMCMLWLILTDGVRVGAPGTPSVEPYLTLVVINALPAWWLRPGWMRRRSRC